MVGRFQIPRAAGAVDTSWRNTRLLDLDLLKAQWHGMSVAEKAAAIAAKLPIGPQEQIELITRLDGANPPPRVIEYRERTVCVPVVDVQTSAPAAYPSAAGCVRAAGQPATPGGMTIIGWGVLALVAGGIFYATVNMDMRDKKPAGARR